MRRRTSRTWDFYPRYSSSTPRAAADGIKARAQKGRVGETWWSQRFIAVLESFRIGARLSRGLRYARSGQVMDLAIEPGAVTAQVQGTRARPYDVRIEIPVLSEKDWRKVEAALAEQAGYLARLLSGEMPRDVEQAFSACKLSLFPARTSDLKTSCSCPDWSNPCKHVAAVYYILAERFDEDPFLVFRWRGRPRDDLLAHLRALRGVVVPAPQVAIAPPAPLPPPDFARFWTCGPADFPVDLSARAPAVSLAREAGPLGVALGGRDLADWLAELYRVAAHEAARGQESAEEES